MITRIDRGLGSTRRWSRPVGPAVWAALVLGGGIGSAKARVAGPPADPPAIAPASNSAERSVAAITPELSGGIVAALQAGQYPEAIAGLDPWIADSRTSAGDKAFYRLVRGGAARLANRPDDARATWLAALEADPRGVWANKLRGELAALELVTGHADRAEVLARTEAQALLAPERKDRLAEVYRDFARRLLEPEFPGAQANPTAAYALLAKGRDLAKGPALRASLLYAMGRAAQEALTQRQRPPNTPAPQRPASAGPNPDPIRDYTDYLKEYPQGVDRDRVRFHLGEIQLAFGQSGDARLTWTDLARDLAKTPGAEQDKDQQALRGQALYGIARTYGVPNPSDKASLALGVSSLRRFLRETPADPQAPLAAFEIGLTYFNQGQADPAIAALTAFLKGDGFRVETDEARRGRAVLAMRATFLIARATFGQGRFPEAVAAFEAYLSQYPNGSESGDARRAILDAQLAAAQTAFAAEQYADARAAWLRFAEVNPLDGRVPAALFAVGPTFVAEKKWDDAITAWDTLAVRFPATAEAAQGQFEAASLVETEKGDPAAAIERFRKITGNNPWVAQANQRIAVMESKALTVVTPRAFRSGETAQLKVSTRNLEKLTLSAYKLNPEAYFRKKHSLGGVADLDIGLVAPDAEWTVPVPGYARYKPIEATMDLKVAVPGVYVVKVSDEKTLQASALVIGSDLEAIVKVSRDQLLVFAQDMKSGRGRPGARVLVADGANLVFEGATGTDGVVQGGWTKPSAPGGQPSSTLQYLVIDGQDAAGSGLGVPDQVARGLSPRAYIDTDRPAYRPGQEVLIRGVVREAKDGQYANPAGAVYKLEVIDSQGRTFVAKETTLSPFGTFRDSIRLDSGAPVGSYRIKLGQAGGVEFAGGFEVQPYQLAKLGLEFDLPRTVYYRGETIRATLQARYGYDAPASGRPIAVRLPDGRTLRGVTDAKGQFPVEFATESYGEDQALALLAQLTADNVAARANLRVAVQGFGIALTTPRDVYLDGETLTLTATTLDALGQPTGQDLRVAVIKPVRQAGGIVEREISSKTFQTDKATGRGQVTLQVAEAGSTTAILRVAGTDQFNNAIVADHPVTITGKDDDQKLRILADRSDFKVGETAAVRLVNRARAGTALIAWEADRILRYQLVAVNEGENPLRWEVDGPQFPNFTLTASRMDAQRFDQARFDVKVERDLRITLTPKVSSVPPRGEVEVEITAVDQMGRPARAELALALVDRTLLRQFGDKLPPIGPFFYDQTRLGSFTTESTNTFTDHPNTEPVPNAVVEEADRLLALERSKTDLGAINNRQARFANPSPANGPFGTNSTFHLPAEMERRLGAGQNFGIPPTQGSASQTTPFGGPGYASLPYAAIGGGGFGGTYADPQLGSQEQVQRRLGAADPNQAREKRIKLYGNANYLYGENLGEDASADPSKNKAGGIAGGGFAGGGGGIGGRSGFARIGAAGLPTLTDQYAMDNVESSLVVNGFLDHSLGRQTSKDVIGSGPPRQRVVETAYWNPSVVTGPDGKATVKFSAPEALSEYRLMAKGMTGADSLAGQSSTIIAVRKNFYVDLRVPARLTEGDRPQFVAQVHHVGVAAGTMLQVRLSSYAGDQDRVEPKQVEIRGDGVTEVTFFPNVIPDAESIRLAVSARAGDLVDEVVAEVPIRPWGVQATAAASGAASDNVTAFVALPAGRRYDDVAMQIQLAPTLDRLVIELAMGRGFFANDRSLSKKDYEHVHELTPPIAIDTTADRASDLLAAVAALGYLRDTRSNQPAEATRLRDRAQGLVAELVTAQNRDGGWPWVTPRSGRVPPNSERYASAGAAWALRAAADAGIEIDPTALTRAGDYLAAEFNRTGADLAGRAAVLHALAVLGRANFEQANALNRGRLNLGDVALAHLALTLGLLERPTLAGEVLDLLATHARSEPVDPGAKPQTYWEGETPAGWNRGRAGTTALVALAFARVRPTSPEFEPAVAWLLAHRSGPSWNPRQAKGPAVAAIVAAKGKAGQANDRYRLVVAVNNVEVARVDVAGAAETRVIPVPAKVLKLGAPNAVRFAIEGRGTYGYAATLTGFARDFAPEQKGEGKPLTVQSREYLPSAPELDGKALPTGFDAVVNPTRFVNKASEVTRGGRVQVDVNFTQEPRPGRASWDREFLIVEETLPAGTTLVDGSVATSASSFTEGDGVITFAFAPENGTPRIRYELAGALPGQYRSLPTVLRNAYGPGIIHLGPVGGLKVLNTGEPTTDPYRPSPDELLARGKALAASGRLAEAAVPLDELFGGYTPNDDVARDAARILLSAHIQSYDARKVVRDFEVLREKGPEVIIPFDEVLVVGRAYRDIGEFERAFLVCRALAEASYLEDAQVGEVLRQNGQTLEAITFLLDLWRESPGSASLEGDLFGLSQVLTDAAGRAFSDPPLRAKLAKAGVSRPQLLAQAIRLIQTTLALSPQTPLADEASLAWLGNEIDLENFEAVARLAPRFATLYPKSSFLDSFAYADALSRFQLGQFDRAIEVANRIARATYPDPNGVAQPSPNKWQALYILGQIHDARRQPALAVGFYQQVADRFADAADAVLALSRQSLKLPEVTIVRPPAPPRMGAAVRLNPAPDPAQAGVGLSYRNVAEVDLKVYPVDLMRLYLTRRNLDAIAGIDLAGITPLHEATIKLGDALSYVDATKTLDLPIATKEGAYLVMVRGGDLYASGIVLVSPIELEVTEEAAAGRVRVVVRDAASQNFVSKVQVKVIGSNNPAFTDGRTDLRGVAVAEGINGQVTAVARNGAGQYAFYRGTAAIGAGPAANAPATPPKAEGLGKPTGTETLDQNLRSLNSQNQNRGIDRLQKRFNDGRKGIQAQEAK